MNFIDHYILTGKKYFVGRMDNFHVKIFNPKFVNDNHTIFPLQNVKSKCLFCTSNA